MLQRLLAWALWPLLVVAWLTGMVWIARSNPASLGTWLAPASLTLILVLIALEEVLPYRRDWSIRGDREVWRDIGHSLLYTNLGAYTTQVLFIVGSAALMSRLGLEGGLGLWPVGAPFVLQVAAVIVLGDLLEYWTHRLSHSTSWLWPVHAIHHSPVRLSTVKAGRHHIVYFWARGLAAWLPLLILGAPGEIILWQVAALGTTGIIAHANIAFRIPAWIQRTVVTPSYHRIHHSLDSKEGNSNFAVVFPIWDRLFGTYTDPVANEAREVGIKDDPTPRSFPIELVSAFGWPGLTSGRRKDATPS